MAANDQIRASDADREVVVTTLREAYAAGRLDLEEFDERTSAAYASKTWGELRKLTADLPAQPPLGMDVTGRPLPPPSALPRYPRSEPPQRQRRRHPAATLIPLAVLAVITWHEPYVLMFIVLAIVLSAVMSANRRR
jgi:hypothetical protein